MSKVVYLWEDPKDLTPRYVGMGEPKRPFAHLKHASNKHLTRMLLKRVTQGYKVEPIILLDGLTKNAAKAIEKFWIAVFGRDDQGSGPLFNGTNGGDGGPGWKKGRPMSDEQKRRLSEVQKGKGAWGNALIKGFKARPETVDKMRASMLGKNTGPKPRHECPHCRQSFSPAMLKRWHFTKCKEYGNG